MTVERAQIAILRVERLLKWQSATRLRFSSGRVYRTVEKLMKHGTYFDSKKLLDTQYFTLIRQRMSSHAIPTSTFHKLETMITNIPMFHIFVKDSEQNHCNIYVKRSV